MNRFFIAAGLCVGVLGAALHAHVVVTPRESPAGAEQTYAVRVPTEGTVPTSAVELEIPAGLQVTQIVPGEGFTFESRKDGSRIVAITWKREIKPKEFAVFTFIARNPPSGSLQWNAHQTFADGSTRHWIGERGTKDPASVTTILPAGTAPKAPAAEHAH